MIITQPFQGTKQENNIPFHWFQKEGSKLKKNNNNAKCLKILGHLLTCISDTIRF